jgi:hypothetical protein
LKIFELRFRRKPFIHHELAGGLRTESAFVRNCGWVGCVAIGQSSSPKWPLASCDAELEFWPTLLKHIIDYLWVTNNNIYKTNITVRRWIESKGYALSRYYADLVTGMVVMARHSHHSRKTRASSNMPSQRHDSSATSSKEVATQKETVGKNPRSHTRTKHMP